MFLHPLSPSVRVCAFVHVVKEIFVSIISSSLVIYGQFWRFKIIHQGTLEISNTVFISSVLILPCIITENLII